MKLRRFFCRDVPYNGMAAHAGYPAADVEPAWLASYRTFLDIMTRNIRLLAWIFAAQGAVLFFLVAASLASAEFGIGPSSYVGGTTGGEELFTRGSGNPVDHPPEVAP